MGGWAIVTPGSNDIKTMVRILGALSYLDAGVDEAGNEGSGGQNSGKDRRLPESSTTGVSLNSSAPESDRELEKIGYFNDISSKSYFFDEHKYSTPKRKLERSEWDHTNRHLPIKIDPDVINKPGQRSPQALRRVVTYTPFNSPRYVSAPGERVTMCNIAAWDWSRALSLHLPHWIGETEMSANMLFRWISHKQAGGIYGEGWQPVKPRVAQLLANRGIPVFALAENPTPRRHGHVALVYPDDRANDDSAGLYFATVNNGRTRGGIGIKSLGNTFRRLRPTYFVHKDDFIIYRES